MKGGARPEGVDHNVYDETRVWNDEDFEPKKLSPKARDLLFDYASQSYQTRSEQAEGNPDAMFPKCTCQRGNSGCNSPTHKQWFNWLTGWRNDHCGERVYVHPYDQEAIGDYGPICEDCRGQKGGFKPKRKKKSKKSKKSTKIKKKKKQTKRKRGGHYLVGGTKRDREDDRYGGNQCTKHRWVLCPWPTKLCSEPDYMREECGEF